MQTSVETSQNSARALVQKVIASARFGLWMPKRPQPADPLPFLRFALTTDKCIVPVLRRLPKVPTATPRELS
jgi:hypothetical protein